MGFSQWALGLISHQLLMMSGFLGVVNSGQRRRKSRCVQIWYSWRTWSVCVSIYIYIYLFFSLLLIFLFYNCVLMLVIDIVCCPEYCEGWFLFFPSVMKVHNWAKTISRTKPYQKKICTQINLSPKSWSRCILNFVFSCDN